jgi:hypothetical protein
VSVAGQHMVRARSRACRRSRIASGSTRSRDDRLGPAHGAADVREDPTGGGSCRWHVVQPGRADRASGPAQRGGPPARQDRCRGGTRRARSSVPRPDAAPGRRADRPARSTPDATGTYARDANRGTAPDRGRPSCMGRGDRWVRSSRRSIACGSRDPAVRRAGSAATHRVESTRRRSGRRAARDRGYAAEPRSRSSCGADDHRDESHPPTSRLDCTVSRAASRRVGRAVPVSLVHHVTVPELGLGSRRPVVHIVHQESRTGWLADARVSSCTDPDRTGRWEWVTVRYGHQVHTRGGERSP